jgi:ABC-type bacteriocin/lantibiotic exporter with double-glycine peptidase domain
VTSQDINLDDAAARERLANLSIEKLNDDFNQVTQKKIKLYPELGSGILTTVIFFMFLCEQNWVIAFILLALSLLQIIPPMLIKRFLQVNYDNCREIEAKLTDFTVSGLRGFAEIKLYDLKGWWLEKLKGYHKDYSRIGSISIYANTAENTLKNFISTILQYGTYAILGLLLLNGYAEMDVCVETIALSGSFFAAVEAVFSSIPQLAVT